MTKEAIALIEEGIVRQAQPDVEALLERARRFRASLNFTVTDADINRFKRQGRP